jgi:hypothetical protein
MLSDANRQPALIASFFMEGVSLCPIFGVPQALDYGTSGILS